MKWLAFASCALVISVFGCDDLLDVDYFRKLPHEIIYEIIDRCFIIESTQAHILTTEALKKLSLTSKRINDAVKMRYVALLRDNIDQIAAQVKTIADQFNINNIGQTISDPHIAYKNARSILLRPISSFHEAEIKFSHAQHLLTISFNKKATLFSILLVHPDCPIKLLFFCKMILGENLYDQGHCDIQAQIGSSSFGCPFTFEGISLLSLDINKVNFIFEACLANQTESLKIAATYPYHLLHVISKLAYDFEELHHQGNNNSHVSLKTLFHEHMLAIHESKKTLLIFVTKAFKLFNEKKYPDSDSEISKMAYFFLSMLDIKEDHLVHQKHE